MSKYAAILYVALGRAGTLKSRADVVQFVSTLKPQPG